MPSFDARDLNLTFNKDELKALYQVKAYRVFFAYLADWAIIISAAYISWNYFFPWLYLPAIILIGARMHALAVVMHDVAHYRFLKNKELGDFITDFFVSWPLLINTDSYRRNHLGHHQNLNADDDPDWIAKKGRDEFRHPQTRGEFFLRLLMYLTAVQTIKDLRWLFGRVTKLKKSPKEVWMFRGYFILLFTALTIFGGWKFYLLFWIVPFFTSFMMFQYIRSFAEHFGDLEYSSLLNSTRSVYPSFLEKMLVAPYNISYHLEHHLYPGVPFYNLPGLRKLLMKDPVYREKAHYTRGYFSGLMEELKERSRN